MRRSRRFCVMILRRRDLTRSEFALERRLIALPWLSRTHHSDLSLSTQIAQDQVSGLPGLSHMSEIWRSALGVLPSPTSSVLALRVWGGVGGGGGFFAFFRQIAPPPLTPPHGHPALHAARGPGRGRGTHRVAARTSPYAIALSGLRQGAVCRTRASVALSVALRTSSLPFCLAGARSSCGYQGIECPDSRTQKIFVLTGWRTILKATATEEQMGCALARSRSLSADRQGPDTLARAAGMTTVFAC